MGDNTNIKGPTSLSIQQCIYSTLDEGVQCKDLIQTLKAGQEGAGLNCQALELPQLFFLVCRGKLSGKIRQGEIKPANRPTKPATLHKPAQKPTSPKNEIIKPGVEDGLL
jgi:hypothetical protein